MTNASGDEHPVRMHRHTFEVTKVGKRTVGPNEGHYQYAAPLDRRDRRHRRRSGPTFFHYQDHMDEDFAGLVTYA